MMVDINVIGHIALGVISLYLMRKTYTFSAAINTLYGQLMHAHAANTAMAMQVGRSFQALEDAGMPDARELVKSVVMDEKALKQNIAKYMEKMGVKDYGKQVPADRSKS